MKPVSNDIILRPRFQLELSKAKEEQLKFFEESQVTPFLVKRLDEHVFIQFNKENNHFWSPQLHLEIEEVDENNCRLYGVFGPNPTLWTLFMFLHFGVATIFLILGIWAFSSAALDKPYSLQLALMGFMTLVWFTLYFFGRAGKQKGKPQTQDLYRFMMNTLVK